MKDVRNSQAGKYDDILSRRTYFMEVVQANFEALSRLESVKKGSEISMVKQDYAENTQSDHLKNVDVPKGQFLRNEEREKGRVRLSVYRKYITTTYGKTLVPFILVSEVVFHILQIGSNGWMTWATLVSLDAESSVTISLLIMVYVALCIESYACIFVRSTLLRRTEYKTTNELFNKMHSSIFHALMSFFDATPSERILTRASTDQSVVDTKIPNLVRSFVFSPIQLLGIIALCLSHQQYYVSCAQEFGGLIGVCKVHVVQNYTETISGSTTIRSFNQDSRFQKINMKLNDEYSHPTFYGNGTMKRLCFRLNAISSIAFSLPLVFLKRLS